MALVLSHNPEWNDLAYAALIEFKRSPHPAMFTIEDFQEWAKLPPPKHWNNWGAIWTSFGKKKLIKATPNFVPARRKHAHATVLRVWVFPESVNECPT